MLETLPHSGDPDPKFGAVVMSGLEFGRRDAGTFILDGKNQLLAFDSDAKAGVGAARVAQNIGETFLNNAEEGGFAFEGEAGNVSRHVELDIEAGALFEAFHIPTQGRSEAELIEQRRMEDIGKSADVVFDFSDVAQTIGNFFLEVSAGKFH